jgi:predicted  nucleic acid-binding Zn-ribbon protein
MTKERDMARMNVNETERTLVERAREVEKLRDKLAKLAEETERTRTQLAVAQKALAGAATTIAETAPEGELVGSDK